MSTSKDPSSEKVCDDKTLCGSTLCVCSDCFRYLCILLVYTYKYWSYLDTHSLSLSIRRSSSKTFHILSLLSAISQQQPDKLDGQYYLLLPSMLRNVCVYFAIELFGILLCGSKIESQSLSIMICFDC